MSKSAQDGVEVHSDRFEDIDPREKASKVVADISIVNALPGCQFFEARPEVILKGWKGMQSRKYDHHVLREHRPHELRVCYEAHERNDDPLERQWTPLARSIRDARPESGRPHAYLAEASLPSASLRAQARNNLGLIFL